MNDSRKGKIKQPKGIYIKGDLFKRLIQFYLVPELKRKDFTRLQIIFRPDQLEPEISFDEDCKKVLVETIRKKGVEPKKEGEAVYLHEITGEVRKAVIEGEEDSLHATFKKPNKNRWLLVTNFLFNQKKIKNDLEIAKQFLNSAEQNFIQKNWHPFIDNLFNSFELVLRSLIIALPYLEEPRKVRPLVLEKKGKKGAITHKKIESESKKLKFVGFISDERYKVYTELKESRPKARYGKGELIIKESEAKEYLAVTKMFLENLSNSIKS